MNIISRRQLIAYAILLTAGRLAFGADGRIEISQLSFSSPPYFISQSGSYVLTENITVTNTGVDGISVQADNVTIDLNGFTITGPGAGSGNGISQAWTGRGLTVCNGKLSEWSGASRRAVFANGQGSRVVGVQATSNTVGIYVGRNAIVRDCTASGNSANGFHCGGNGSVVSECVAVDNGQNGIFCIDACTIEDCTTSANLRGIETGDGCVVRDCTALENSATGIDAGEGASVVGCSARGNGLYGIKCSSGSVVSQCSASMNTNHGFSVSSSTIRDCTARWNMGTGIHASTLSSVIDCLSMSSGLHGIYASPGSRIRGNLCYGNGREGEGAGISVSGHASGVGSVIEGNTVQYNDIGIDSNPGTGNYIGSNRANANTVDYDIAAGNTQGSGDLANVSF